MVLRRCAKLKYTNLNWEDPRVDTGDLPRRRCGMLRPVVGSRRLSRVPLVIVDDHNGGNPGGGGNTHMIAGAVSLLSSDEYWK